MRLTLRNLLAYMDDLLSPESARVIQQKTEESEFASSLLRRIRDVTRRSKLGAPKVFDRKEALNPNTVAEYLDNTLPADRVTDFEKFCLDSDVELAEVAACHQILTLVLGEPAEVRAESRVRMYHLPETAASHTYVEREEPGPSVSRRIDVPDAPPAVQRRPVVPEYLMQARRRRRQLIWLAVCAAILCVVTYLASSGGLSGMFGSNDAPSEEVAMNVPVPPPATIEPGSFPEPPIAGVQSPEGEVVEEESPVAVSATEPPLRGTPIESMESAAPVEEAAVPSLPTPESVVPVVPTVPSPSAPPLMGEGPEAATTGPADPPVPPGPDPGQVAAASTPPDLANEREPMIAEPALADLNEAREIGRLFTPEEMALVSGEEGEPFYRIANSKPLETGQRVVSLPTSRPVIGLDGRLHVEMVDGGELRLLPAEENRLLNLGILYGRLLFATTAEAGTVAVSLRADSVSGDLVLSDATTLVALELTRADGPIRNPLSQPAALTVRLWGVSGEFSWKPAGGAETSFESPIMVDLAAGPESAPSVGSAPEWVRSDLTSTLDRRASAQLNKAFDFEKPADLFLRENAYHRQKEVRQLARRSLSWIEDFEPVVAVLDDPERYVEWPEVIDLLRDSVRRNPRTARAVRAALAAVYGDRGDELYELLWKYDAKELSAKQAKQLVQYLEDPTLACRVLSFRNLNRVTGLGYYYRPEESELERRPSVQRWTAWADRLPGAAVEPTGTPPAVSAPGKPQPAAPR